MIALASDCLLFEMAAGESIPVFRRHGLGGTGGRHGRSCSTRSSSATPPRRSFITSNMNWAGKTVSAGEFAGALEKVLRGFAAHRAAGRPGQPGRRAGIAICAGWRMTPGRAGELVFFPRLRAELRRHLQQGPRVLRFRGLRGCVKQLGRRAALEPALPDAGGGNHRLPARMPQRRSRAGGVCARGGVGGASPHEQDAVREDHRARTAGRDCL